MNYFPQSIFSSGWSTPWVERRRLLATLAGLGVSTVLPGHAWAQGTPLTDVLLSVPGPGNALSMPLELAVKLGLDKQEGIALRLKFGNGGGVAIQDLLNGNAEYAVFGLPAAMHANFREQRLVALAAMDDLPLYTLMVRTDLRGKVKRIADLKGLAIGVFSNSLATKTTTHQVAELLLRTNKVPIDSVRIVSAGASWETQSSAFISGAIDATVCDEPFGTRLSSEKLAFQLYSTGNPADVKTTPGGGFLRATLIARRDRVQANPVLAERMVKMVKRTLEWIASNKPEQIADALSLPSEERKPFIDVFNKYPRQLSRDAKFSQAQMRETELFVRASAPDNPDAQRYAVDSMVMDQWAGRKP